MTDTLHHPPTITYSAAARAVEYAIAYATTKGWRVAVAVVDPSGALVAAGRMDGVPPGVLEIAMDKAYTTTMGRSTKAFGARMVSDPQMALGAANRPRSCAWEGGEQVFSDAKQVAGIGVSGAAGHEDAECAQFALGKLGLSPN